MTMIKIFEKKKKNQDSKNWNDRERFEKKVNIYMNRL